VTKYGHNYGKTSFIICVLDLIFGGLLNKGRDLSSPCSKQGADKNAYKILVLQHLLKRPLRRIKQRRRGQTTNLKT